jgi:hypothetical protein
MIARRAPLLRATRPLNRSSLQEAKLDGCYRMYQRHYKGINKAIIKPFISKTLPIKAMFQFI